MFTCSTAFTDIKSMLSKFFRQSLLNLIYKPCWVFNCLLTTNVLGASSLNSPELQRMWTEWKATHLCGGQSFQELTWTTGVCYPSTASFPPLSPVSICHPCSLHQHLYSQKSQLYYPVSQDMGQITLLFNDSDIKLHKKMEVRSTPVRACNYSDFLHSLAVTYVKSKHLPSSSHTTWWFLVPSATWICLRVQIPRLSQSLSSSLLEPVFVNG